VDELGLRGGEGRVDAASPGERVVSGVAVGVDGDEAGELAAPRGGVDVVVGLMPDDLVRA